MYYVIQKSEILVYQLLLRGIKKAGQKLTGFSQKENYF